MAEIPVEAEVVGVDAAAVASAKENESAAAPWPHPLRAWYTLWMLILALVFSFIDRTILTLMINPIEADWHLSDTQVSLLVGVAFVLVYAFSSLPIARWADSRNRKIIIGAGVAFWSVMTMCCGLAQSFGQLFVARIGVGAGESSFAPATYSVLADSFPRDKLAMAAGLLGLGVTYGSGIALILGGQVIGLVSHMANTIIPGIGVIHPWQWAFICVGLPGILVALVIQLTVKEPARQGKVRSRGSEASSVKSVPIGQVIKFIADDWKCYGPMFGGMFVRSLAVGVVVWLPTFFQRTYHWTIPQIGLAQGLILLVASPIGIWLGGRISQRWTRQNMWDCNLRLAIFTGLIALPTSILYPLSPNPYLTLGLMAFNSFVASIGAGPASAALQLITPNQMRGVLNSLNLLIFNVASAAAPTFVALLTDFVFGNNGDLRYSIMLVSLVINPLAILITWIGLKPYGRAVKRAVEEFA